MKLSMSRFRRSLSVPLPVAVTLIAISALFSTTPAAAADAGIFDADCDGKPAAHIIKDYTEKDGTKYPLRCGTSRYGYIHIRDRHGFLAGTDGKIAYALKNYQSFRKDSTTSTTYFSGPERSGYRAVVEQKAYSDGRAQGIITAY